MSPARLISAVVVWLAAVAAAVAVSTAVSGSIHTASGSSATGSTGSGQDPSSVRAADPDSFFRARNFARAVSTIRARLGPAAVIDNFVVYPGYISVTALRGGGEVDLYVAVGGRLDQSTSAGAGTSGTFPLTRIGPRDTSRLARRISALAHLPLSQLHYMTPQVDPIDKSFHWLIYPVQGTPVEYFQSAGVNGALFEYRTDSTQGLRPVRP